MKSQNTFDIADFFILIVKWKKFLLFTLFFSAVISYLSIYFFVEEKYDSYGLIIPFRSLTLGRISIIIPKASTIRLRNSSDPTDFSLKIIELLTWYPFPIYLI